MLCKQIASSENCTNMRCTIMHCMNMHCTVMRCTNMRCMWMQSRLQRGLHWESWPLPTAQTWHNRPCNAPNLIYSDAAPKISNCQNYKSALFPLSRFQCRYIIFVLDLMGNIGRGNNKWEMWNNRSDKSEHNKGAGDLIRNRLCHLFFPFR